MQKRRFILLLIAGVVLLGAFGFAADPGPEPEYGGKKLSEWVLVNGYDWRGGVGDSLPGAVRPSTEAQVDAGIAIHHIGTNAIPCLLKWIRYEPPLREDKANTTLEPLTNRLASAQWSFVISQHLRADGAVRSFRTLGLEATGAVDELTLLMNGPHSFTANRAAFALSYLGRAAVPAFLAALTNRQGVVRQRATALMEHLGTNARSAIPVLIPCLKDPDEDLANNAAQLLGKLKLEAGVVVPALIESLSDSRLTVRHAAVDALREFRGEASVAVPALRKLLDDPDSAGRWFVTNAIRQIDPSVLPSWLANRSDEDRKFRIWLLESTGTNGHSRILEYLNDADPKVRADVAAELRKLDQKELGKAKPQ